MLNPIIKWAGGKRWMKDILTEIWLANPSSRFVEPFCGALGASLAVSPKKALLNDFNGHLIELYRGIKRGEEFDIHMENNESLYYQYRQAFNEISYTEGCTWETAQLFFYMIQTGFNGLCRFNTMGEFNVPFGKYKNINYERDLEAYRKQFRGWTFSCKDFGAVKTRQTDFLFIDSPYHETFSSYTPEGFSWEDQIRLADYASSHEGPVVCTNNATQEIMFEYLRRGFEVRTILAPRSISSGERAPAYEMIACKNTVLPDSVLNSTVECHWSVKWKKKRK